MKSYIECMGDISSVELYDGLLGYGMFSEKLPPIFSSKQFLEHCKQKKSNFRSKIEDGFIFYESMRNTNIPRPLGIPTPMTYANLCLCLKENWDKIMDVFRKNTENDSYKVSRIHIRKRNNEKLLYIFTYDEDDIEDDSNDYEQVPNSLESEQSCLSLFSMNYKNWKHDGDPLLDFVLGKKYVVKADVSQCFPSIYTHAITWALVGKQYAKQHRNKSSWYNQIDTFCQKMRNGETHGILIGPHSSNVISEILLTSVDKELRAKNYEYIRNIDDYTCYVETREEAEKFLVDLNHELRKFDFSINHKKTVIESLPQVFSESWIRQLKDKPSLGQYKKIDYSSARAYLDTAISLMQTNGNNASILFFAIKTLQNKKITKHAKNFCIKTMSSLAVIYPYLVTIMEKYVFQSFDASNDDIERFSVVLCKDSIKLMNFEGVSYALYFAIKYDFCIKEVEQNADIIINSTDCISKLLLWLYCKNKNQKRIMKKLKIEAKRLKNESRNSFAENWLFVYEVLSLKELKLVDNSNSNSACARLDEWIEIKKSGISFIDKNAFTLLKESSK